MEDRRNKFKELKKLFSQFVGLADEINVSTFYLLHTKTKNCFTEVHFVNLFCIFFLILHMVLWRISEIMTKIDMVDLRMYKVNIFSNFHSFLFYFLFRQVVHENFQKTSDYLANDEDGGSKIVSYVFVFIEIVENHLSFMQMFQRRHCQITNDFLSNDDIGVPNSICRNNFYCGTTEATNVGSENVSSFS